MHSKFVNTIYIATKNPNILKNKTDLDFLYSVVRTKLKIATERNIMKDII